jgi:hypothetical protein
MERTASEWMRLILADAGGTPAASASARLLEFEPSRLTEMDLALADAASWVDPQQPERRRLLFTVGANVTSLDEAAGDPAEVAVQVANIIQDYNIDELGRAWPVALADGSVLEPRRPKGAEPRWVSGTGLSCAFGELDTLVAPTLGA